MCHSVCHSLVCLLPILQVVGADAQDQAAVPTAQTSQTESQASDGSSKTSVSVGGPQDCDAWQKAKINLPRLAGPIHNHEVEPQILAEQATQLASGLRCLTATLGALTRAVSKNEPEIGPWQQAKDALLAEGKSLQALTVRVDVLTKVVQRGMPQRSQTGCVSNCVGQGPNGGNSGQAIPGDDIQSPTSELNALMQSMQNHESRLADLTGRRCQPDAWEKIATRA